MMVDLVFRTARLLVTWVAMAITIVISMVIMYYETSFGTLDWRKIHGTIVHTVNILEDSVRKWREESSSTGVINTRNRLPQ